MLGLCKQRFPDAEWILSDMRKLTLEKEFDCVIAWQSLFHLPHEFHEPVLSLFFSYVKPGGLLVFTSGDVHGEIWAKNGGIELYHASLAPEVYHKILEANKMKVLIYKKKDPMCGEASVWVAQK
jgi:SAM-dependent methyltransferase